VYSVAHRLLRDDAAAEDVTQDVFVSIWRGAATFDRRRGSVRSWILAHAHHKSVDVLRRRRLRATAPLDDEMPDDADVVDEALGNVASGQVRAALGRLRRRLRRPQSGDAGPARRGRGRPPRLFLGSFMGLPATGKQIATHGVEIYRLANDKIAERWGSFDVAGMLMQIGWTLVPPVGTGSL
jgi:hypothetical protein